MNDQFCQRFEEGLRAIQNGIASKGGTKKKDKVCERIGRLKEKYVSIHQYYQITVLVTDSSIITTGFVFQKTGSSPTDNRAGIYFFADFVEQQRRGNTLDYLQRDKKNRTLFAY